MSGNKNLFLVTLVFISLFLISANLDPEEEFGLILTWEKPDPYPVDMLGGMDIKTLSLLLDGGNLQWYQPRPVKDKWAGVVGMKIHAPPEVVWKVITDYKKQCEIMPETFIKCETEYRKGNEVKNNYLCRTSVLKFGYNFDMIDIVKEDPPYKMTINTIEGGLKFRELNILMVPVNEGQHTLFFMRYYSHMESLGVSMQMVLKVLPMVEPPIAVGASNYHSRAYKNEAEKQVGYKAPQMPPKIELEKLDHATLKRISEQGGGIIRETPEGKVIDGISYVFIDAPPERVWEVAVDFDHFEEVFPNSKCEVISRTENEVIVNQRTQSISILIFSFGYDMHAKYNLDPPYHLDYIATEGVYAGSHGDLTLVPLEGGKKTLLFGTAGVDLDNDESLTSRIATSGAFPAQNMMNLIGIQLTLRHIEKEALAREKKAKGEMQ
jgi:uncharacterized protein YndB with AHSA1/START domain